MTSNFDFMRKKFPELAEFGENAEKFLYDNPKECVYNISLILESIVKFICRQEGIDTQRKTIWGLIDELMTSGRIEKSTFYVFENLRDYRNVNTHTTEKFSLNERMTLLQHIHNLCEWFMASRVDRSYRRKGFLMPRRGERYPYSTQQKYERLKLKHGSSFHGMSDEAFVSLCQKTDSLSEIIAALQNGANPNAKSEYGETAFLIVSGRYHDYKRKGVEDDDFEVVIDAFLKSGADFNSRSAMDETALMIVALDGVPGAVYALLMAGADVNIKNEFGYTALMWAAMHSGGDKGGTETVDILLRAGAEVNAQTIFGQTALMLAANNCNVEVLDLLVNFGANVNVKAEYGLTALMHVFGSDGERKTESVKTLLKFGADVKAKDKDGNTVLMYAVRTLVLDSDTIEAITVLLTAGCNVKAKNKDGRTALMEAMRNLGYRYSRKIVKADTLEIIDLFVCFGADINAKDKDGRTALRYAAKNSRWCFEAADALWKAGAKIDAVSLLEILKGLFLRLLDNLHLIH